MFNDLTGQRFGRLVAIEHIKKDGATWWRCKCDCGSEKVVLYNDLKRGYTSSCGCYRREFRKRDLKGQRFGRLTVIGVDNNLHKHQGQFWVCRCDCGNEVVVRGDGLTSGHTKGCGCENKRRTKHGQSKSKLFKVWTAIKQRCSNENDSAFKDYGDRGIYVCEEWGNSFETFYSWCIENGYKDGLEIDRIDNNGPYSPDNCRITTHLINMNNRRNTLYLEYNGEKKSLTEWSKITGICRNTLDNRYHLGWGADKILTTPTKRKVS